MLAVYLSLSLTKNINSKEITIILLLLIIFATIFFCHALVRLCMMAAKERRKKATRAQLPEMQRSEGYAMPPEPIRVVLARDEEAAGIQSEATTRGPPAYGVWRESVRVDPDRLYWMRSQHPALSAERESDTVSSVSSGSGRTVRRPPSYSSDDGVSYVVGAQPRSTASWSDTTGASSHSSASQSVRAGRWI
ncbi:hypothetical protein BT67DRAFT_422540 [Trichocladium antarcticum]|uniref:Uncharacterized protein n=1 Tax=Trichocladium antarcticum TaxID=1450529 RepID=A0AAN6UJ76_9PEZI|nr:hypothetical protein BT67DRAFT_422540 [Trichocladium antarcticum]